METKRVEKTGNGKKPLLYLGVDGGGTKTTGVVADEEGKLVRKVRKGPGNVTVLNRHSFSSLIEELLTEILGGESLDRIAHATFAFAGVGRPSEREKVVSVISEIGVHQFTVMTDAEILHYSIFRDEPGLLLSAGTGSICLMKTADMAYHRFGGWGYLLGDEGSGFDIGRHAVRFALQEAQNGESAGVFSRKLLTFFNVEKAENLISAIMSSSNPPSNIASCAKMVCESAEAGDHQAERIIEKTTAELLNLAGEAIRQTIGSNSGKFKVSLAGSILASPSIVNRKFKELAVAHKLQFEYVIPEIEPAAGGVLYSLKNAGRPVSNKLFDKLRVL